MQGTLKAVNVVWLSKVDLSNINSGEGGAGAVVELKTYDHNTKPYASGQSVRHALREAISREFPEAFKCTPEFPCGNVQDCWLCDLFGYLLPKSGVGADRRWSPIKVSPALGQTTSEIITDLLLRMSIKEKGDGDTANEAQEGRKDQRLVYVQLAENIFKTGMSIDVGNVGKVMLPEISGKGKEQRFAGFKEDVNVGSEERRKRIIAILEAIGRLCDFAKQARNAVSLAPDVILISLQPVYSQRGLRALNMDDSGNVNLDEMDIIVQDLKELGADLWVGYTPGVASNDQEAQQRFIKSELDLMNPIRAIKSAVRAIQSVEL